MNDSHPAGTRLSVSIVLHNSSLPMLDRVLQSLARSAEVAHAAGRVGHVLVEVLDNSCDEPFCNEARAAIAGWPQSAIFRVVYRRLADNRGFGAGHNSAIHRLDSDFHLVLNPDAELAEDALSSGLTRLQEDPGIVLLSPRVQGPDGVQEFLCKRYPAVLLLLLRAFAPHFIRRLFQGRLDRYEMRDLCSGTAEAEIPLASGCFMLARSAALQSVGGFDERYFLYFEDFDLSLRLGSQGRLVFSPAMHIVHHGGYAANKGLRHIAYFVRSGTRFFRQHGWRWI
ncbi:MAG: glycosyltransferase [Halieaceae bacterium]|nr:glycosyltransferase [Halieaceae bacterium]